MATDPEKPALLEQFELMIAVHSPAEAWERFEKELATELGRIDRELMATADPECRLQLRSTATKLEALHDEVRRMAKQGRR